MNFLKDLMKIKISRIKKQLIRTFVSWLFFMAFAFGLNLLSVFAGDNSLLVSPFILILPTVKSLLVYLSDGKAYGVPLLFASGYVAAYFLAVIPTVVFYWYLAKSSWFRSEAKEHITDGLATIVLAVTLGFIVSGTAADLAHPDPNTDPVALREKAENGDDMAQFRLGRLYSDGHNVEQNYSEAAKWLRMAADQGNSFAYEDLAVLYYSGEGVKQDYAEFYF